MTHNTKLSLICIISCLFTYSYAEDFYRVELKKENIECELNLNNIFMFSSYFNNYKRLGNNVYERDITAYLQDGKNNFTVKAFNVAKSLNPYKLKNAYCEINILKTQKDTRGFVTENSVISSMKIKYKIVSVKKNHFDSVNTVQLNVSLDSKDPLKESFDGSDSLYPYNVYEKSFSIEKNNAFPWSQEAKPVDDKNNEVLSQLWLKYEKLTDIFQNKDTDKLKIELSPLITENAKYFNIPEATFFKNFTTNTLAKFLDFEPENWYFKPIDKNDYELKTYADNKLFRLVKKGSNSSSPIALQNRLNPKVEISYDPLFIWSDGKVKIAILE